MRIFIGINLPSQLKNTLSKTTESMDTGNKVSPSNYHITLVYLGETSEAKKETLHRALKTLVSSFEPCQLTLSHTDTFKKGKSHIVYVDVIKTHQLEDMQDRIKALASSLDFSLDDRPYNPHITLARQVKDAPSKQPIHETFLVRSISLFLSHRVAGELIYTPIETYPLKSHHDDGLLS